VTAIVPAASGKKTGFVGEIVQPDHSNTRSGWFLRPGGPFNGIKMRGLNFRQIRTASPAVRVSWEEPSGGFHVVSVLLAETLNQHFFFLWRAVSQQSQ